MTDTEERAEQEFNDRYGSSYATIDKMSKEECWEEGFCVGTELFSRHILESISDEKLNELKKVVADNTSTIDLMVMENMSKQIIEAEEIIKEYMFCTKGLFEEVYPELIKKAEAFLKE